MCPRKQKNKMVERKMKITKSYLKQIIKKELLREFGGVSNFGGLAGQLGAMAGHYEEVTEDDPDSIIQQKALEFFRNVELTPEVVHILVNNIAIPDLITLMRVIPKIGTAEEEELHEVYSDEQRSWACAQDEEKFKEMCTGPMKKKKGKK